MFGTSRTVSGVRIGAGLRRRAALTLSVSVASLLAVAAPAAAEAPVAGTIIGNQAVATFSDGFTTRSVTSNLVQTEINQIFAVEVEASQTKTASVDGLVSFPHTVTNAGNGVDSFRLAWSEDLATDFDSITIYADADNDGVPDSATPINSTPSLAPGEQFGIVIEANLSPSVGSPAGFRVAATSIGADPLGTIGELIENISDTVNDFPWQAANDDDITISSGPLLDVTKSVTFAPSGDVDGSGTYTPGDILTFRLTYSNSQPNTDSVAFIVDDLDLPFSPLGATADLSYVPDSVVWSDGAIANGSDTSDEFVEGTQSFGTPDASNGSLERIDVFYNATDNQIEVGVDINSGSTTREGYVEFDVVIGDLAVGTPVNVARIFGSPTDPGTPSNRVPIPITSSDAIALVLNDISSGSAAYGDASVTDLADAGGTWTGTGTLSSATDDGSAGDDVIEEGNPVAEGSVVPFQVVLTNHSNLAQVFNLAAALDGTGAGLAGNTQFPAGTTFSFYTAGGAPLLDADSNGAPDVLVGANSAVAIEVRADLPLGYSTVGASPTNAGDVPVALVTATSSSNSAISNSTLLLLGDIAGADVDLENAGGLADGVGVVERSTSVDRGDGVQTTAWTTNFANPGETTSFTLVVQNGSLAPDSYNLAFSNTDFNQGILEDGWSVVFRDSSGRIVTNTGLVAAGGSKTFTADVTVPDGELPGDFDLYFRVISATNGAQDTKRDQVVVREVADLQITPDRSGQLAAGGALVLGHTVTNLGNVAVTEGAISFTGFLPINGVMEGTLYLDDGDGILELDGSDIVINNIDDINSGLGLAPGESVTIFDRVQASSAAVAGLSESATITVADSLNGGANTDANPGNNSVRDTVSIVSGDFEVLKRQALDSNCDGTADDPNSNGYEVLQTTQIAADPGQCIIYEITATNTGTADATSVQIIDGTPAYTTQNGAASATGGSAVSVSEPGDGFAGDVISSHGTVVPGAKAVLTFAVEIDK